MQFQPFNSIMISNQSWNFLKVEFEKPYFSDLMTFVNAEFEKNPTGIFPKKEQIFRAFDSCNFEDVKVVILGQDPYPTKGHAHGLCFSVQPDLKKLPKSLINIFKELDADSNLVSKRSNDQRNGDLTHWAKQGVFLLNSILTVREGEPMSHANKGWELFTDAVLKHISENREGVVFLLWGSKAIEKVSHLNLAKHLVLTSVHPSPLSAYRGFFGCNHFSKANQFIAKNGEVEINWQLFC